jgi:hypothetical protein
MHGSDFGKTQVYVTYRFMNKFALLVDAAMVRCTDLARGAAARHDGWRKVRRAEARAGCLYIPCGARAEVALGEALTFGAFQDDRETGTQASERADGRIRLVGSRADCRRIGLLLGLRPMPWELNRPPQFNLVAVDSALERIDSRFENDLVALNRAVGDGHRKIVASEESAGAFDGTTELIAILGEGEGMQGAEKASEFGAGFGNGTPEAGNAGPSRD